jgi:hypothetical protein
VSTDPTRFSGFPFSAGQRTVIGVTARFAADQDI